MTYDRFFRPGKILPLCSIAINQPPSLSLTAIKSFAAADAERLGDHTDYGTIMSLLQDDVGGLEMMTVDGKFIPATPIKHAILLNTGDLMQRWSGGIIKATVKCIYKINQ